MTSTGVAIQALREARDLLSASGWVRRSWRKDKRDGRKCYCALGAVGEVTGDLAYDGAAYLLEPSPVLDVVTQALWDSLSPQFRVENNDGLWKGMWDDLTRYNDARYRTKEQVLALYDRAIKRLEKQEAQA